jgi:hypothetical protein
MFLAEACLCLERNTPPINEVCIDFYNQLIETRYLIEDEEEFPFFAFTCVASWRQLGEAINNNPTIRRLHVIAGDEQNNRAIQPTDECVQAFLAKLYHNESIVEFHLEDPSSSFLEAFDLGDFLMRNSPDMMDFRLGMFEDEFIRGEREDGSVTLEQADIISIALEGLQLKKFNIQSLEFGNNGAFEQIISHCLGVETLEVKCYTSSHYTALAELLRNPRVTMQTLSIEQFRDQESDEEDFDHRLALSEIEASLVHNVKLKSLYLSIPIQVEFDTLLCNSTSLNGIVNSNHTLETIWFHQSAIARECLELNKNQNKTQVVQNKIMHFYFVGSFDLAPFASMPLSVLTKVISVGQEMRNKQTAIFELLRGLPELCNVSSRRVETSQIDLLNHIDFKRQKVHKFK